VLIDGREAPAAKERTHAVSDISIDANQADEDCLATDVSDEALETAAGMSAAAQAGASLWSTVTVSGCTCVS
jgi:hypothetical protein